ncbi:MAG: P1 family peptidase [Alphaproteobacteria bacterium]
MSRPGPRNLITDVDGVLVGHASDPANRTGSTVLRPVDGAWLAAGDVRGGAPGTRETELLSPTCRVDRIDAICLSGGSAFGLAAADGAMEWLAAHDRGLEIAGWRVPIVPSAIIFDLAGRSPSRRVDYRALGHEASASAAADFALGNAGAGYGARAGVLKGGIGSASLLDGPVQVGALAVVNCVGSVLIGGTDAFWAWPLERDGEFGGRRPPADYVTPETEPMADSRVIAHTTVCCVATNVTMSKADAQRVAIMAQDGLARAIRPVHTPFDGDTVFVVSTGAHAASGASAWTVAQLGAMAADCLARAVARGVYAAADSGDIASYRTIHGGDKP